MRPITAHDRLNLDAAHLMVVPKPSDEVELRVAAIVAAHAGAPLEQIRSDTRLWHDLGLAGDDFADVIEELHHTFGITLRGGLRDYCPDEGDLNRSFFWWPFGRKRTYRELPLAELAAGALTGACVG